ncbi:MAG: UDP-N-acetylmuramoyl-L-alanine--D-glutamate ligase [Alphaproteobacteria bacterium]|nr:UDP-N-acetylmuramoyl-L-alanine--D-glutamate ligase [Alphaproteobacteria bacterium]
MIRAHTFQGQTVAVMGLARSGLASVRSLLAGGARVLAWDDSAICCEEAVSLGAESTDLGKTNFSGITAMVLSPGIPHTHPAPHPVVDRARAAGVPIIGDIELLLRACPDARVIGITGTNGKSTTTALIGHILTAAGLPVEVGGNIGRSALEFEPMGAEGIFVLELSSYQLQLVPSLACDRAVLLNISPDHLERHGDLAGYIAAKQRTFDGMPDNGVVVIGDDDAETRTLAGRLATHTVTRISGLGMPTEGVGMEGQSVVAMVAGRRKVIGTLSTARALPGSHNAQNACAATAVALSLGVSGDVIRAALLDFAGLPHRQEMVGAADGITYVNDSKATNADAAARALSCYDPIYWIVGGVSKQGGIEPLAPYFPRVRRAFLIGESTEEFAATLEGRVPYSACDTLDRALDAAAVLALSEGRGGATILLSPASASFDQFSSYEVRGDCFRDMVCELLGNGRPCQRRAS